MTPYLLDASVLIALTVAEHENHDAASAWAASIDVFAVCPVVEGALVRFLVRLGEGTAVAKEVLRGVRAHPRCEFWPDDLSYLDASLGHVLGHRQVTDAYLASLAAAKGGSLATLDQSLAVAKPDLVTVVPLPG